MRFARHDSDQAGVFGFSKPSQTLRWSLPSRQAAHHAAGTSGDAPAGREPEYGGLDWEVETVRRFAADVGPL